MHKQQKDGLSFYSFPLLEQVPGLKHGCFTRQGGYSTGRFDSLNLGATVGDDAGAVQANRDKLQSCLGATRLIRTRQVHGTGIVEAECSDSQVLVADAIVTTQTGHALLIGHADCQAALIVDPLRRVAAGVHSGWRGSVQNIYAVTVDYLRRKHGCDPRNLLVGIGPSLGPEASEFINYKTELSKPLLEHRIGECHFDFWSYSERQLQEAGVLPEHIQVARICTHTSKEEFFSYRRDKVTGRNASVLMWT